LNVAQYKAFSAAAPMWLSQIDLHGFRCVGCLPLCAVSQPGHRSRRRPAPRVRCPFMGSSSHASAPFCFFSFLLTVSSLYVSMFAIIAANFIPCFLGSQQETFLGLCTSHAGSARLQLGPSSYLSSKISHGARSLCSCSAAQAADEAGDAPAAPERQARAFPLKVCRSERQVVHGELEVVVTAAPSHHPPRLDAKALVGRVRGYHPHLCGHRRAAAPLLRRRGLLPEQRVDP
jgi:hypothetical protein